MDTPDRKLKIFIYNFPRGHFKEPEYENKQEEENKGTN
jgi:hypothetical protein